MTALIVRTDDETSRSGKGRKELLMCFLINSLELLVRNDGIDEYHLK
jgi:hypothetical protein